MLKSKKILLVEDEPLIAKQLTLILSDLGVKETMYTDNASEVFKILKDFQPDLFLLDINISGDTDGIQLALLLRERGFSNFIFITSYHDDDTIFRAQHVQPLAYILKPFTEATISSNLNIAFAKILLQRNEEITTESVQPLFVKTGSTLLQVQPKDILFAEAFDNYTYIQTKTDKHLLPHTLKYVSEKLISSNFVRSHKKYIVNINHVNSIQGGVIYIAEHRVRLGKVYKQRLLESIQVI